VASAQVLKIVSISFDAAANARAHKTDRYRAAGKPLPLPPDAPA
jgi:hypothetical protein